MEELLNLKEFRAPRLLGYVEAKLTQVHHRNQYLGPTLLPTERTDDLEFEYLRGHGEIPVMASIVDFSSPAPVASRVSQMDKVSGELVTMKQKIDLNVKQAQRIQRAMRSGAPNEMKDAVRRMYNDVDRVVASLAARVERLRWQALADAEVLYRTPEMEVRLDYQRPAVNVLTTSTDWSNFGAATPLTDLRTLCDTIAEESGVRPTRAICRSATWSELLWNENETKEWIHGRVLDDTGAQTFGTTRPVLDGELQTLLRQMNLPDFVTYDVKVMVEDPRTKERHTIPLVPENCIILLPPPNVQVGQTLFGPTPAQIWNQQGYQTAIRELSEPPRFVVRVYKEGEDPGVVWTLGEATAVPQMMGIDYVGRLNTRV